MVRVLWLMLFVVMFSPCATADAPANPLERVAGPRDIDITATYSGADLSELLKPRSAFIGFVGDNYQRLRIAYTEFRWNDKNPKVYQVTGYSIDNANRCKFTGEITIDKILVGTPFNYGSSAKPETAGRKQQGFIAAHYRFREDVSKKGAGVFEGTMKLFVYVDALGRLVYDAIDDSSIGYANDLYTGTWTAIGAQNIRKVANWGEWRVPGSGDLDGNERAERVFWPNHKYFNSGWDDYDPQYRPDTPVARTPANGYVDLTAKYIGDDLTDFFKPRSDFIGFIGTNYQRLQIVYDIVKRDGRDPHIYHVAGHTLVRKSRCAFSGEIVIGKILAGPPFNYDDVGGYEAGGRKWQGSIEGHYRFAENPNCTTGGVFEGTMNIDVYVDASDRLKYDDIDGDADGYANSQYEGTWEKYGAGAAAKVANWGEWRIPNSGDLDGGAGEFYPNEQYRKNGWEDYKPRGG